MMLLLLSCTLTGSDERPLIDYFFETRTHTGLVLDRDTRPGVVSVAATGFGMAAWAIAAEDKIIPKEQALEFINRAFDHTNQTNPKENRGWLYHFTCPDGKPIPYSEVSTVDTAIFYLGAMNAAKRLKDQALLDKINKAKAAIDVNLAMGNGHFHHGFRWFNGQLAVIGHEGKMVMWDENSEGILLYRLFGVPYRPKRVRYDLPLFTYFYPLCFYDDPTLTEELRKAMEWQRQTYGYAGVTACDGPNGYQCSDTNMVSPVGLWGVEKLVPTAKDQLDKFGVPKTVCGLHTQSGWTTKSRLAIDYGSALLLRRRPL
jgi:hypothetical protein